MWCMNAFEQKTDIFRFGLQRVTQTTGWLILKIGKTCIRFLRVEHMELDGLAFNIWGYFALLDSSALPFSLFTGQSKDILRAILTPRNRHLLPTSAGEHIA
jgi:hypothetical protein